MVNEIINSAAAEIAAGGASLTAIGSIKGDSLLGVMYKDSLQPSVQIMGKAIGSIIELTSIPFKYLQLGNDRINLSLKKNLDSYQDKIKDIQLDEVIEVNPHIGVPLLEKLAYTTNEEIADLFTSLLAKASSSKTVNMAHPAFIQMISSLSSDEAVIVKKLEFESEIKNITFKVIFPVEGHLLYALQQGTMLNSDRKILFPNNIPMYFENLKALGVLESLQIIHDRQGEDYDDLLHYFNYERHQRDYIDELKAERIDVEYGTYYISKFGRAFIDACTSDKSTLE